jgi:hypothetical protein
MKVERCAGQKDGVWHGLNQLDLLLPHIRFKGSFEFKTFNEIRSAKILDALNEEY